MSKKMAGDPSSVRGKALDTLLSIMERDQFCDQAMHLVLQKSRWDERDRRFYTRLVSGTVERAIELDYILDQFSKIKVKKMKPVIRNLLRMSLYQILYMDQIPPAAVCNEAVKLAEKRKFYPLKGFVNGVLRTILREKEDIRYPDTSDRISFLRVRYSMPEWIVKRWISAFGENISEEICQTFFKEEAELTIRCQQSNCSVEVLKHSLEEENVIVDPGNLFSYACHIRNYPGMETLSAFQSGFFSIQDESSMVVGEISGVKIDDFVLDLCAAPGGKTLHIADLLQGSGHVVAADLSEKKLRLIRENAQRLAASNVEAVKNDALVFKKEWEGKADLVIADLPCSGLGVIGKKSDIKYKTKPEDIFSLSELQKKILGQAVRYVKPGGKLIYSTCTIAREENEDNVFWMEKNLPLKRLSFEERLPEGLKGKTGKEGYLQILPNETGTDGFFVSLFEKIREER